VGTGHDPMNVNLQLAVYEKESLKAQRLADAAHFIEPMRLIRRGNMYCYGIPILVRGAADWPEKYIAGAFRPIAPLCEHFFDQGIELRIERKQ